MKAHILKLKSLVLVALMAFSFMACSDDDDDPCEGLTGVELANCTDRQL